MAAVFSEWVILAKRAYAHSERLSFRYPSDEQILETLHELDAETVDQCCHQQASVVINQLTGSSTPILARLVDRADELLRNQQALAQLLGFSNNEPLSLKQEAISALARGYADLLILAVRSQRDVNAPLGLIMPLSRAQETILAKLNHEVVWAASHDVANSVFKSERNHILARQMPSLFAKLGAAIEENRLINRFIVNGASNSQIHDLFGLHAQETGWRRRVLGVAAPAGHQHVALRLQRPKFPKRPGHGHLRGLRQPVHPLGNAARSGLLDAEEPPAFGVHPDDGEGPAFCASVQRPFDDAELAWERGPQAASVDRHFNGSSRQAASGDDLGGGPHERAKITKVIVPSGEHSAVGWGSQGERLSLPPWDGRHNSASP